MKQNDNRKDFIEALKSLIDRNLQIIDEFIEKHKGDKKCQLNKEEEYSIKKLWNFSNILVFSLGVLEFSAGAALLYYGKRFKIIPAFEIFY